MKTNKLILDACCGSRMFWFDKRNPMAVFMDKRSETLTAKDSSCKSGIRTIEVGRELRISRIKVNMLIQTIPHKRLSCGSFAIGYTLATKSIEKFVKRDVLKRHNRELSRVQARYSENLILNNQNK